MSRPLSGKVVVVTRPRAQARVLTSALRAAGARVIVAPVIRIAPPSSYRSLDAALKNLDDYDGIVFTSRNAVDSLFDRAEVLRLRLTRPRKLYSVGPETSSALQARGWRGALQPKIHRAEMLARTVGNVRGLNLLIPRARAAQEVLPRLLRRRGARVTATEAYRTVADRSSRVIVRKQSLIGIDAVTFTSGSTVDQFVNLIGNGRGRALFKTAKAVSIGPVTSAALRAHGIEPAAQAKTATAAALVRAVKKAFARA